MFPGQRTYVPYDLSEPLSEQDITAVEGYVLSTCSERDQQTALTVGVIQCITLAAKANATSSSTSNTTDEQRRHAYAHGVRYLNTWQVRQIASLGNLK